MKYMKHVIVIGGCHIPYPAFQENLKSKYEYAEFINTHITSSDFTEKLNSRAIFDNQSVKLF